MKLLKFLKLFFKKKLKSHQKRGDKKHTADSVNIPKKNKVISYNKIDERECPLCKNHCNLASPRCKRGKEYAKKR
jgi:hypothetical protein